MDGNTSLTKANLELLNLYILELTFVYYVGHYEVGLYIEI